MSRNPFDRELVPYGYDLTLLDRDLDFDDLDSKCSGPRILNYRYISPRGTGKSTLLNAYFSEEKRQELARDHKQLVYICQFSGDEMRTDADVFVRLIDAVTESLDNLDTDSAEYTRLYQELEQCRSEYPDYESNQNNGEALLRDMLTHLKNRRYYVTLVLDEFHQLACAKTLADSTFSKMAAIGQKHLISYIVASDYDDEVGTESYYISPFSRIFASSASHLPGIESKAGRNAMIALIRQKLSRYPDIVFTDGELNHLLDITAGIPGLLKDALREVFAAKSQSGCELSAEELTEYALAGCHELMDKWVQYFDDARWETAEAVVECVSEAAIRSRLTKDADKLSSLTKAGLIIKNIRRQEYHPICPLFKTYLLNELSRRKKNEIIPAPQPEPQRLEYHYHFSEGTKFVQGDDHSQNLTAQNVQIQNGLTVSNVLELLGTGDTRDLFASRLSEQLRKSISTGSMGMLPRSEYASEEAYEEAYDQAFSNAIQDLETDEEQDLVVTPAEMQTLDSRFADARTRCRTYLTDELLSQQSERCQFYLKLSVIVEDALELPGIQMEDYSPQLVLYGKALEQALRDNFYDLFHKDSTLSVYNTYHNCPEPYSDDVFANKTINQTLIGNYTCLIAAKRSYLVGLCQDNPVTIPDQPADINGWNSWWNRLNSDVSTARKIRNLADHADSVSPDRSSLNNMCDMLLGSGSDVGILPRTVVGKQLRQNLFPPEISHEVLEKFLNNTCRVQCTTVKKNGGIKGVTCDGGYPVNISPKRAKSFREANSCQDVDFTGKILMVKVLECTTQDNKDFFGAQILELE